MTTNRKITASFLGYCLDGWADLIEGMGSKVDMVYQGVMNQLQSRNMPDIKVEKVQIKSGLLSNDCRDYSITTTSPGVTTTIYVSQHGSDLFTSWRSFIRPTINWKLIILYAILSVLIAMLYVVPTILIGFFLLIESISNNSNWDVFGYLINALIVAFSVTPIIFFAILFLALLAGFIFKRSLLAFILYEPNLFDAEDITAMNLSVHKSLLRALDEAGIKSSNLRLKHEFKGGRRGDTV